MNGIKKFFAHPLSYKLVLILLVIGICALLFPMLLIGKYNIPSADDFANGYRVHEHIIHSDEKNVFSIAIDYAKEVYNNFQGTFSALLLFALDPIAFGEDCYVVVPYIMLFTLIFGICFFIYSFFSLGV